MVEDERGVGRGKITSGERVAVGEGEGVDGVGVEEGVLVRLVQVGVCWGCGYG